MLMVHERADAQQLASDLRERTAARGMRIVRMSGSAGILLPPGERLLAIAPLGFRGIAVEEVGVDHPQHPGEQPMHGVDAVEVEHREPGQPAYRGELARQLGVAAIELTCTAVRWGQRAEPAACLEIPPDGIEGACDHARGAGGTPAPVAGAFAMVAQLGDAIADLVGIMAAGERIVGRRAGRFGEIQAVERRLRTLCAGAQASAHAGVALGIDDDHGRVLFGDGLDDEVLGEQALAALAGAVDEDVHVGRPSPPAAVPHRRPISPRSAMAPT